MGVLNESLYSSQKMDWATPQELFDRLDAEFGFKLDVCAVAENAKCDAFLSPEIDGLSSRWSSVNWMNPPYGRGIDRWVEKAFRTCRDEGSTCVCLLPVRSDTRWWHDYVMKADEIRFLTRRLSFQGSSNKAPFPAAIVVFRPTSSKPRLEQMVV